jgi:hypothetical protein
MSIVSCGCSPGGVARLAIALLVGLGALGAVPTDAGQLMEGMTTVKAFRIEFNARTIGQVVVVGCDTANPPAGYSAGQEYWTWEPGAAWRGTFTLVPVDAVPDHAAFRWTTFAHQHFDLSHTVPMPAIAAAASDRFYRVQVRRGAAWVEQGWMWLVSGSTRKQEWFGRDLTSDLVGDDGASIRFASADIPAPGSRDVYLLAP